MHNEPTLAEIKAEFRRSNLWRHGWTFASATADPLLYLTLRIRARAHRRDEALRTALAGERVPQQMELVA